MMRRSQKLKLVSVVFLILLGLAFSLPQPASADARDAALFYGSLAALGTWVSLENYGPVWYPNGVGADWRPYLNGRWVPTPQGWVFETGEPWGGIAYHYGNWMPTSQYGWVWNPGSTWYPSTAVWRTNNDYVGWAPIPPQDYFPEPAFAPYEGYYPGTPGLDLLTAPFWLFATAAEFLLGFGQPFGPGYSYGGCGCLAPFNYVPFLFTNTFFLHNFCYPAFAPGAFFAFGPPFEFISRVGHVNMVEFNNFVNTVNITRIANGLPSQTMLASNTFLRQSIPGPVLSGQRFQVENAANFREASRALARPDITPRPAGLPALSAQIPKGTLSRAPLGPQGWQGMKGVELPRQAVKSLTPQMQEQIHQHQLTAGGAPGAAPAPHVGGAPKEAAPPHVGAAPRAPAVERGAADGRAPAQEFRAPAPHVTAPSTPREFRAPSAHAAPQREFWATPQAQRSFPREFRSPPVAPHMAPTTPHFAPSAPAPHAAPAAPAPHAAPSAPARPSGGMGGEMMHR